MPVVMDLTLLWVALGLAGGAAAGYALRVYLSRKRIAEAAADAARILREAEKEAESKRREAELEIRDRMLQARTELERETRDQRNELQGLERRLLQREELLNRQIEILDRRDKEMQARLQSLQQREAAVDESEQRLRALLEEQRRALERVAGMTTEEAKRVLLKELEEEARREGATLAKRIEEEAKETAEQKAKEILAVAVDRCSTDFVAEATVSVVDLPSDDMKGRIIGREGRNIRAFEKATGIDVIVDDTPEAVILSGFDSVRREVARIALQRLIVDGRIHPARIEEVVEKVKKEIEEDIKQAGEQALFEVGVTGMHPELTRLIGRLKYRTSYSQNQLQHTKEVTQLAGIIATELRVDPRYVKRAALLHDIGKTADSKREGTHTEIAVEVVRKHNEHWKVINAIAAHHGDEEVRCLEAIILQAADTLSAARPGARREILESYVKRLEKLEEIANSFKGVSTSYAIQAGREVRIIVESGEVTDTHASQMAKDIAKRIEQEIDYPGQVKVTVIRETRSVEYAK